MSARAQRIDEWMEAEAVRETARAEGLAALANYRSHVENMGHVRTRLVIETDSSEAAGRAQDYVPSED